MRKVLVITYYWPPSGGSGVQRWLKFCKYLRDFGWEPVVYTPEDPDVDLTDSSLESDIPEDIQVVRRPIFEPRRFYRKLAPGNNAGNVSGEKAAGRGATKGGGPGLDEIIFLDDKDKTTKQKLLVWIRTNFFIPDARKFWIKPSVDFLSEYLKEHPVDAVVSTGPPQSMHLIARALKRKLGLPWLADFRDPWTGIVYFDKLPLTDRALRRHRRLESEVLTSADAVVSVSRQLSQNLEKLGGAEVHTISNGYDDADLEVDLMAEPMKTVDSGDFLLSHVGFLTADRIPDALWHAIAELTRERDDFASDLRIRFVGRVDDAVFRSARRRGVDERIESVGYVPHLEAICHMRSSDVLLLIISEKDPGVVTGKLFEYLAAGRSILLLGPPNGDAAAILDDAQAGVTVRPDDPAAIKSALSGMYDRHQKAPYGPKPERLTSTAGAISLDRSRVCWM